MKTDKFTKPEIVTIATLLSGGDVQQVDREDIAMKANEIAPGRFCWRKYPEQVDLEAVCTALRDAKKPKNGGLLKGSNAKGWMVTPSGLTWLLGQNLSEIDSDQKTITRKDSGLAILEAEANRLRNTRAYRFFIKGEYEKITLQDFYQFTRVNEYFQTKARERRYSIIDNATVNDELLSKLWTMLKTKFNEEIV